MARISCPECGNDINEEALSCPYCGLKLQFGDLTCPKCSSKSLYDEKEMLDDKGSPGKILHYVLTF